MPNIAVATPFLKWAGGKRWLMKSHPSAFAFPGTLRYVEPFLGSGAAFFSLNPKRALLNDANNELIGTYLSVRDEWEAVVEKLFEHDELHGEEYYYRIRASAPQVSAARAARFIYLNRTCFNGLYRVNKSGRFNVPIGTKSSVVLETDDFKLVSERLSNAELACGDFEHVIERCGSGDFIYADPPYTVKHNNNGFIKYNEKLFSWADQERLQRALVLAKERGAIVVISNADHPSLRELYGGAVHVVAERHSIMASESDRRKKTTELLISL